MPPIALQAARKSFARFEWKAETEGAFRASFAKLNVVDKDGDVTLPGAFPKGQAVLIGAYGHMSWSGELPVGDGVIGEDTDWAYVDGQFWLDTAAGEQTYKAVKRASEKGLQEWSYGYEPKLVEYGREELAAYPGAWRILKQVAVFEVSPVLRGAGDDTHTDFVKSMRVPFADHGDTVLAAVKAWSDRSRELASLRQKEGRVLSDANRTRLASLADALDGALSDVRTLLEETDPDKDGKSLADALLRMERDLQSVQNAGLHYV